ncbi:hypothetical protein EWB00_000162, partial [Schistosoma japonicum]
EMGLVSAASFYFDPHIFSPYSSSSSFQTINEISACPTNTDTFLSPNQHGVFCNKLQLR